MKVRAIAAVEAGQQFFKAPLRGWDTELGLLFRLLDLPTETRFGASELSNNSAPRVTKRAGDEG